MRAALAAGVLVLATAAAAPAATIRVPGDQPTIQAGLDAAASGDTVLVAAGIYAGPGNRELDFGGKAIVLRSAAGAASTIIDGQNAARGFHFEGGEPPAAVVDGFTVRNGYDNLFLGGGALVSGSSPTIRNCTFTASQGNQGGAIYAEQASLALTSCTFTGNSASNYGGAIFCLDGSLTLVSCAFSQNSAVFGGGIAAINSPALLTGCTFTANPTLNSGGAIYCRDAASFGLTRCTLSGNSANVGAGIYCLTSPVELDSCTVASNTARSAGGGLYCENIASLSLADCTFTGNRATVGNAYVQGGGAVVGRWASSTSIVRCVFSGNSMGGGYPGGAAYLQNPGNLLLADCTFSDNSAAGTGGGLLASTGNPATIQGCSFSNNTGSQGGGAVLSGGPFSLAGCSFTGNHASRHGGGVWANSYAVLTVTGCLFSGNSAGDRGGGLYRPDGPCALTSCTWSGNSAGTGGALYFGDIGPPHTDLSSSTFHSNSAAQGGAILFRNTTGTVSRCTFARNSTGAGAALALRDAATVDLDHTIIAASTSGEAVACEDEASVAVLSCTDIFGNAGGDWTGCIADQLGINGCFAADPRFCAPLAADFTLAEDSPCAPAHSPAGCGLIGAHPVGCVTPIGVAEGVPLAARPVLRVVPNPVVSGAIVEWSRAAGPLELYDPGGRLVLRHDLRTKAGRAPWAEIAGGRRLAAGVYFLRVAGAAVRIVVTR